MCHFWYIICVGLLGFLFENAFNVLLDSVEYMTTNEILYQCSAIYRIQKSSIHEMRNVNCNF